MVLFLLGVLGVTSNLKSASLRIWFLHGSLITLGTKQLISYAKEGRIFFHDYALLRSGSKEQCVHVFAEWLISLANNLRSGLGVSVVFAQSVLRRTESTNALQMLLQSVRCSCSVVASAG